MPLVPFGSDRVAIAAVLVAIAIALWPTMRKRRKQEDKKTVEAALEIERALQGEK